MDKALNISDIARAGVTVTKLSTLQQWQLTAWEM
jgi:hypothetical protein